MSINLSRGSPIKHYSSDRISSLLGNGLLTFIDKKTKLNNFFNNNEVIFYSGLEDLANKINYYKSNDTSRMKIAKNGSPSILSRIPLPEHKAKPELVLKRMNGLAPQVPGP